MEQVLLGRGSAPLEPFTEYDVFCAARGVSDGVVKPSPATHAILAQLKAGECVRHAV